MSCRQTVTARGANRRFVLVRHVGARIALDAGMGRFLIILSVAVCGCSGQIGEPALQGSDPSEPGPADTPPDAPGTPGLPPQEPAPPGQPPATGEPPNPWVVFAATQPATMRRLTNVEIEAAVRDLVGEGIGFTDGFPPEERLGGFENNAAVLTFPPTLSERAFDAARRVGDRVAADPEAFAPCATTSQNRSCGRTLIGAFAARAWRRQITDAELDRLMTAFDAGVDESFETAVALGVQATMLSLPFYYLIEDETTVAKPGFVALDGYERASRLAFFLWRSPPDEALLAAAANGGLATAEGVRAQAERLLDSPKAGRAITEFHRQWLELDRVAEVNKDPEQYPEWDDMLSAKMRTELDYFIEQAAIQDDSVNALLTARYSYQDEALRRFYADGSPTAVDGFERIELPERRAGLLARGGFLIMEGFDQTSPVLRGLFVREKLLCGHLPPPPDFVDDIPSAPSPDVTTRSRTEAHANDPQCAGCHVLMDPIGFGLERFDAIGRWRDTESGQPIDDRGNVINVDIGEFTGAAALGQKLAESAFFRACFVRKWFRFALGRTESREDLATLQSLDAVVADTGSYRALQLALTQTDDFLYRRTEASR